MRYLTLLTCAFMALLPLQAKALTQNSKTEETVQTVTPDEIKRAESWLQNLHTAQARFIQTTGNGTQLVGTFYLSRPGKLRFEYDPPLEDFIVADGVFIYFYDGELKEQTNAPIQATLANFLLRKDFSFGGDITVAESKRAGGFIQIKLVQTDEPEAGSLTFAFTEDTLQLKKWRVTDPQGAMTEVELFYLKTGLNLDPKLFVYIDPNQKDPKKRYND